VLLYDKYIIQFAGEKKIKIGENLAKLVTDKMDDCFMRPIRLALFLSKTQSSPYK